MTYPQIVQASEQAWEDVRKEVAEVPPQTLLFSNETSFRPMTSSTIHTAYQRVEQIANTSRIVAYLRAPDSFFLSYTQEKLKHLKPPPSPSRTYVRDTITPFIEHWNGPVSLNIYDRQAMEDGDIVSDFIKKFLTNIDATDIPRKNSAYNTSVSSEAMALLYEFATGHLEWRGDRHGLVTEIRRADRKMANPTKPKMRPGVSETLVNWAAPDLFWLREEHGIIFPSIDYDVINPNEIDDNVLRICRIEDICEVNPDRKAALLRRARRKAQLPRTMRRWLAKY
jgi:hypothetical protein